MITECVQKKKHNKVHVQHFFTPTTTLNFEYTVLLSQSPRVLELNIIFKLKPLKAGKQKNLKKIPNIFVKIAAAFDKHYILTTFGAGTSNIRFDSETSLPFCARAINLSAKKNLCKINYKQFTDKDISEKY